MKSMVGLKGESGSVNVLCFYSFYYRESILSITADIVLTWLNDTRKSFLHFEFSCFKHLLSQGLCLSTIHYPFKQSNHTKQYDTQSTLVTFPLQKHCSANKTHTDLWQVFLDKDDRRVKLYLYCVEFSWELLIIFVLCTITYRSYISNYRGTG